MLIDSFLPDFDVHECHALEIAVPAETVYAALRNMRFSGSRVIRALFALRGLPALFRKSRAHPRPASLGLSLSDLLRSGFILLGELPQREILLGLIGKFWTTTGSLQKVTAQEFNDYTTPGFAKAVWNFSLTALSPSRTRLATETRVLCLEDGSRRRFRVYWFFIRPFSACAKLNWHQPFVKVTE